MDPSTVGVAAARSIGKIGSAAISRYKPVGVARVGSPEDRAQAYKRMLDAAVHFRLAQTFVGIAKSTNDDRHPLFVDAMRDLMTLGSELLSALLGVQLCAPKFVIDAAEKLSDAAQKDSKEGMESYKEAQVAFLNAARYDLDYNPKRWQVWKKRKSKKFAMQPKALTRAS